MGKTELRLEIDTLLLEQARAAEIQLTVVVERALKQALGPQAAEDRARRWEQDGAASIEAHNRFVEENGAFGANLRTW